MLYGGIGRPFRSFRQQPPEVRESFMRFVNAQVEEGTGLQRPAQSHIRDLSTSSGVVSEVVWPNARLEALGGTLLVGVRYKRSSEDNVGLDLRVFSQGLTPAHITQLNRATYRTVQGLVIVEEQDPNREHSRLEDSGAPGTPQTLATALDREPFDRELVEERSSYGNVPREQFYGVIGLDEWRALGSLVLLG